MNNNVFDDYEVLLLVHEVDSAKSKYGNDGVVTLSTEAYTGVVAVAVGNKFLTDFDFTSGGNRGEQYYYSVIEVHNGDMYGVVDRNGELLLWQEFEDLLIISEVTAFAKVDGKYGIIGYGEYEPPREWVLDYTPFTPFAAPTMPTLAQFTRGDWSWHVPPEISYEINYCDSCGFSYPIENVNNDEWWTVPNTRIDEKMGMPTFGAPGAHGYGGTSWVYDRDLDLFGRYYSGDGGFELVLLPFSEHDKYFADENKDYIRVVERIDSTKRINYNENDGDWFFAQEAYSGEYAVFLNGDFITEFIYSNNKSPMARTIPHLATVVDNRGKYGMIGADGEAWVPFVFDGLFVIDPWTAFAKQNGRWGIIAFNGTAPGNRTQLGIPAPIKVSGRFNAVWQVVEESGKYVITDNEENRFVDVRFDLIENHGLGTFKCYVNDTNEVYTIEHNKWADEEVPWYALHLRSIVMNMTVDLPDIGVIAVPVAFSADVLSRDDVQSAAQAALAHTSVNDGSVTAVHTIVVEAYDSEVAIVKMYATVNGSKRAVIVTLERPTGLWSVAEL
ncbi:MAG: hypothetical protein FWG45_07290, partial [Oscillospiraceae bacterium]|nr:hypothetical protein [Oscillospiraceae bacterium]